MAAPLIFSAKGTSRKCALPNFDYFDPKSLSARNYYLRYLWEEYKEICEKEGERPYAYSSFCQVLLKHRRKSIREAAPVWYPGEYMMGYFTELYSKRQVKSGDNQVLFVAILQYSDYTFMCLADDFTADSWMRCCIKAFRFFGGVPHVTECSVSPKSRRTVNSMLKLDTLQAFAAHYHTVLYSAGPKTAKTAETQPKPLTLRNFSVVAKSVRSDLVQIAHEMSPQELDEKIIERLHVYNNQCFEGNYLSRKELFERHEAPQLLTLPSLDYDLSIWSSRQVQSDYHVNVKRVRYSVPYSYAFERVRVRHNKEIIEIFSMGEKIAEHSTLKKPTGRNVVTNPDHRAPSHRLFANRLEEYFLGLAEEAGSSARLVMQSILASCRMSGKGFRPCKDFFELQRMPSAITLEEACALSIEKELPPTVETIAKIMTEERY